MPKTFELGWQQFVDSGSLLWVFFRANISSGFVHHPEFDYWDLLSNAFWSKHLDRVIDRNQGVLVDTSAINADEAQRYQLLSLMAGTHRLLAYQLGQANHLGLRLSLSSGGVLFMDRG